MLTFWIKLHHLNRWRKYVLFCVCGVYLCELGNYKWRKSNRHNPNNETRFQRRTADSRSGRKTCNWAFPKRKFSSSPPSSCSSIWFLQELWKWKMFCFVFCSAPAVSSRGLFQLCQSARDLFQIWKISGKLNPKKIPYIPVEVSQTICADLGLLWQWEYFHTSVMAIPLIHSYNLFAEQ